MGDAAQWARALGVLAVLLGTSCGPAPARPDTRPSVLVVIADDWSWNHTSVGGDPVVQTPAFDRIAAEGVRFTHAFAAAPTCTASRGALLTGQEIWRLAEGANLWATLPARLPVYPDLLESAGYRVGFSGKGWGPGEVEPGGRERNPAGPEFEDFESFLESVPAGAPFAFWHGSKNPHRPYASGAALATGRDAARVRPPPFLPDVPEVREDLLDYYAEVEAFDGELLELLAQLDAADRARDTLVVVTSDNGQPFPRAKSTLYDAGLRVPLALRWPAQLPGGRVADQPVSLVDLAPTFLEAAGLAPPPAMSGRSLLSSAGEEPSPEGRSIVAGRERHVYWYPARAIRTATHLYVRNLRPELAPRDADPSPSLEALLGAPELRALAFDPRPAEELYDVRTDPFQLENLAGRPEQELRQAELRAALEARREATDDPWLSGRGEGFEAYPSYGSSAGAPPP